MKERIGRFLSEAQIEEEFSHTVLHCRRHPEHAPAVSTPPATATPAAAPAAAAAGGAAVSSRQPSTAETPPRWPFPLNPLGLRRPTYSPSVARGRDAEPAVVGVAAAAGREGRATPAVHGAQEARKRANDGRKAWESEAKEERALGRERGEEYRQHGVREKKRANVATAALSVGQKPSPPRRTPSRHVDPGVAKAKTDRAAEDAAKRAKERATVAKAAARRSPPRGAPKPEVGGRAQARASPGAKGGAAARRPSASPLRRGKENSVATRPRRSAQTRFPPEGPAAAPNANERGQRVKDEDTGEAAGLEVEAEGRDGRAFQRVQNSRGAAPASVVAVGKVQARAQEERHGQLSVAESGVDAAVDEANAILDQARRRRAARAVFGSGFGEGREKSPAAPSKPLDNVLDAKESSAQPPASSCAPEAPTDVILPAKQELIAEVPTPPRRAEREANNHTGANDIEVEVDPVLPAEGTDRGETVEAFNTVDNGDVSAAARSCGSSHSAAEENVHRSPVYESQRNDSYGTPINASDASEDVRRSADRKSGFRGDDESGALFPGGQSSPPGATAATENRAEDAGDGGGGMTSPRIHLGLGERWLQQLEAKMGAIKAQVDQIKSPPDFLTRRRGERGGVPGRHVSTPAPSGGSPHDHREDSPARKVSPVAEGPSLKDWDTPDANRAPALRAFDGEENDGIGGKVQDKLDEFQPLEDVSNPSVYLTPVPRGTVDSQELAPSRSQSQAKLLSAAAAIEAAAAAFAAIPEKPMRTPITAATKVRHQEHAKSTDPSEKQGVKIGVSGRVVSSKAALGSASVITTPAQRRGGRGGREAWKPKGAVLVRSEKKPPRRAAAIAAELERHSDGRKKRKTQGHYRKTPRDAGEGGKQSETPSSEERVKALRAARDRERAELRAMIAQRRRQRPPEQDTDGDDTTKCGGGDGIAQREICPVNEPEAELKEWNGPSAWAAILPTPGREDIKGTADIPASDPPPSRRPFRGESGVPARNTGGWEGRRVGDAKSGERHPRGKRGDDGAGTRKAEVDERASVTQPRGASRNAAKRQEELRAFIAKERQQRREKKLNSDSQANDGPGDDNVNDHDEDDISVWTAARPSPSLAGAESSERKSAASSASQSPRPAAPDALRDGFAFSARKKLAFEVDEEDKICVGGGRNGGRGLGEPTLGDGPAGLACLKEGSPGGTVKGGDEKRGASELPNAPGGEDVVNGARLSRQRRHSDDILAELSTQESLVVGELHEVARTTYRSRSPNEGDATWSLPRETIIRVEPPAISRDLFPSASMKGTYGNAPPAKKDRSDHESCASLDSDVFWSRAGEPGVLEGVHPGLATYESQRVAPAGAAGVGAHGAEGREIGARAEEYALMLEQMQEVLKLGDGDGTDSSWGHSNDTDESGRGRCGKGDISPSGRSDGLEDTGEGQASRCNSESSRSLGLHGNDGGERKRSPVQNSEPAAERKQLDARKEVAQSGEQAHGDVGDSLPRYGAKLASKLSWRSLLNTTVKSASTSSKEGRVTSEASKSGLSLAREADTTMGAGRTGSDLPSLPSAISSRFEYSGSLELRQEGLTSRPVASTASGLNVGALHSVSNDKGTQEDYAGMTESMPMMPAVPVVGLTESAYLLDGEGSGLSGELGGLRLLKSTSGDAELETEGVPHQEELARDGKSCTASSADFASDAEGTEIVRPRRHGDEGNDDICPSEGQAEEEAKGQELLPSGNTSASGTWRGEATTGLQSSRERPTEERLGAAVQPRESVGWFGGGERVCSGSDIQRVSTDGERLSLDNEEATILRDRLVRELGSDRFHDACRYLRAVDLGDGDEVTMEKECILGGVELLKHLPDLRRLVAWEETWPS